MRPRNAVRPVVQTGMLLVGAGFVLAEAAWMHMRSLGLAYGAICGAGGLGHCAACPASALLIAAGLAALTLPRTLPRTQAQAARAARGSTGGFAPDQGRRGARADS